MKYFLFPLRLLWRLWFYLLVVVSMLVLFPFFLIFTSSDANYKRFWWFARGWSYFIIYAMGFRLKVNREQEIESNRSYIFCANHTSFLDPWKMVAISKNPIVFVGKHELTKMPVFGYFYKRSVITVDRNSPESRRAVYQKAKQRLKGGTSIAIFPEGLVPNEEVILAPFKNGAFSLAIEFQIPIVPQVYFDGKRLFSWDFFKGHPGTFRISQLALIDTKDLLMEDKNKLKEQTFNLIETHLKSDIKYMSDTDLKR